MAAGEITRMRPAAGGLSLAIVFALLLFRCGAAIAAPGDLDRDFGERGFVEITPPGPSDYKAFPRAMAVGPHDEIFVLASRRRQSCAGSESCDAVTVLEYGPNGVLNPDFAPDLPLGAPYISSATMAVDREGRVLIAMVTGGRITVVRLSPDGMMESRFGVDGRASLTAEGEFQRPRIAISPDGEVVLVAGIERWFEPMPPPSHAPDYSYVALYRLTPDGDPDLAFGTVGGAAVFNSPRRDDVEALAIVGHQIVISVAVEPACCQILEHRLIRFGWDGKILADSRVPLVQDADPFVGPILARRSGGAWIGGADKNGALLTAYGRSWRRALTIGTRGSVHVRGLTSPAVVADRTGRLVLLGTVTSQGASGYEEERLTLARRLVDGRIDRTFAGGHLLRVRFPEYELKNGTNLGLAVQSDGGIAMLISTQSECVRSCAEPRYFLARLSGGTARARCRGHRATVVGTRNSETISGTPHGDVIAGLGGADTIVGRGGNDLICGGRGADFLHGGRGRDRLFGGRGADSIESGFGLDHKRH
jgi:hypothetical protein